MKDLTIGMAVYDDFDGVYFTLQALRLAFENENWIKFLVVDNNPDSLHGKATKDLCKETQVLYIPFDDCKGTSQSRNAVFENASTEWVMCIDSHVLLKPEGLTQVFKSKHQLKKNDLYQGIMLSQDLKTGIAEMEPKWRQGMFGAWKEVIDLDNAQLDFKFEIEMQGLGLFLCHKESWLGFNKNFIGFGGEEGYIHEKYRQNGGKVYCLTPLQWLHRFSRPDGVKYPNLWSDRIGNYFYGFLELGRRDLLDQCVKYFHGKLGTMNFGLELMKIRKRMGDDFPELFQISADSRQK